MKPGRRAAWAILAGLLAATPLAGRAGADELPDDVETFTEDALPFYPSARETLQRAFDNLYHCDYRAEAQILSSTDTGLYQTLEIQVLRKWIDGRLHWFAEIQNPGHLRDTRILQVEADGRADDTFVYFARTQEVMYGLQASHRVRRFSSTTQRGDRFFGSGMAYDDILTRRAEDYEVVGRASATWEGEPVSVLTLRLLDRTANYDRLQLSVSRVDHAILEYRYFHRGHDRPFQVARVPRSGMRRLDGHTLPTQMLVENLEENTATEVRWHQLDVNAPIDERVFSGAVLERRGSRNRQVGH